MVMLLLKVYRVSQKNIPRQKLQFISSDLLFLYQILQSFTMLFRIYLMRYEILFACVEMTE